MDPQLKGQRRDARAMLPRLPPNGGPQAQNVTCGTKMAEIADERSETLTIVIVQKSALWDSSAPREGRGVQAHFRDRSAGCNSWFKVRAIARAILAEPQARPVCGNTR